LTKLEQLANEKREVRWVLDILLGLYTDHNGCLWHIGTLYNRIQKKFRAAGPAGLNVKDFESETASLKAHATRNSTLCYQIGIKYNELRQLIGQNATEVLAEKYQMLALGDLAPYGKVAATFSEEQVLKYGVEKMVQLVEYAELNRITLSNADPGGIEISLIHGSGGWTKSTFRACSADDMMHTVVALKTQRGLPVDNGFFQIYLD